MAFTKTSKEMQRRAFILRAYDYGNISKEDFEKEMAELEPIILEQKRKWLEEAQELEVKVNTIKKKTAYDGDMKRAVADILHDFMRSCELEEKEIKGVFRQGYKKLRRIC